MRRKYGLNFRGKLKQEMTSSRVQERLDRLRSLVSEQKQNRMYVSEFPDKSFQQWHSVNCSKIDSGVTDTLIRGSVNHFMIWCEENCSGKYVLYRKIIWFENEQDATLFLMVWG